MIEKWWHYSFPERSTMVLRGKPIVLARTYIQAGLISSIFLVFCFFSYCYTIVLFIFCMLVILCAYESEWVFVMKFQNNLRTPSEQALIGKRWEENFSDTLYSFLVFAIFTSFCNWCFTIAVEIIMNFIHFCFSECLLPVLSICRIQKTALSVTF